MKLGCVLKRLKQRFFTIRLYIIILSSFFTFYLSGSRVGLLVVATGKYNVFVPSLIESARKYFLKNHEVRFFIFADNNIPLADDITIIFQKRMGWPFDTLKRFEVYLKGESYYHNLDYLFACDADMLFNGIVGNEILGKRVGTLHPGFVDQKKSGIADVEKSEILQKYSLVKIREGTYDQNSVSKAFVGIGEGRYYFAGGFWGAEKDEFIGICKTLTTRINDDLSRNYIALWHDESHLNRYFIDYPPAVILPPSYCYPGNERKTYKCLLWALVKDHNYFRSND